MLAAALRRLARARSTAAAPGAPSAILRPEPSRAALAAHPPPRASRAPARLGRARRSPALLLPRPAPVRGTTAWRRTPSGGFARVQVAPEDAPPSNATSRRPASPRRRGVRRSSPGSAKAAADGIRSRDSNETTMGDRSTGDRSGDRSGAAARLDRSHSPAPSRPQPHHSKGVGSRAYVQLLGLGSDARDTSPSVLLFTDNRRYVFNVGEGFQRFAVEQGVTLRRLSRCFLTRVGSHTSGGLVGMLLTMADGALEHREDEPELVVHGPPRVERLRAAVETLVSGRGVRFDARAFPLTNRLEPIRTTSETSDDKGSGGGAPNGMISLPKPALEDDVCVVTPVVVAPRRRGFAPEGPAGPFGRLISDATTPEGSDEPNKRRKLVSTSASTAASAFALDPRDAESVIYDVQLRGMPGKFDAKEAERLGVPRGKLRAALVRGEDVRLDDGRVIASSDVVAPTRRGLRALVVDVPTAAHLAEVADPESSASKALVALKGGYSAFEPGGNDATRPSFTADEKEGGGGAKERPEPEPEPERK